MEECFERRSVEVLAATGDADADIAAGVQPAMSPGVTAFGDREVPVDTLSSQWYLLLPNKENTPKSKSELFW